MAICLCWPTSARGVRRDPWICWEAVFSSISLLLASPPTSNSIASCFYFLEGFEAVSLYWLVFARGLRKDPGIYSEIPFLYSLVFLFEISLLAVFSQRLVFFFFHFWHCPKSGAKSLGNPNGSARIAGRGTTLTQSLSRANVMLSGLSP